MGNEETPQTRLTERDATQLRRLLRVFTVILIVSGIAGAWFAFYKRFNPDLPYAIASKNSPQDPMADVSHVRVNDVDLWIPVAYFTAGGVPPPMAVEPNQSSLLLLTLYPEFEPLTEKPQKLWEKGEWHRNVRILLADARTKRDVNHLVASFSRRYSATEFKQAEYGLRSYSQPQGVKDDRDLWIEGDASNPKSIILCGKKRGEPSNPQCSHYVWDGGFQYKISFDRKLLPEWREIRDKSLSLVHRFKSRDLEEAKGSDG